MSTVSLNSSGRSLAAERPSPRVGAAPTDRRVIWLIVALVPILAAVGASIRVALNGDVTYVLGSIRAAGLGGVGVSDVFVVRPYLYRLFMSGLDHGRQLITPNQASWQAETVVRLEANLVVAAIAILLYAALRRRSSTDWFAAPVALAVGAALMLSQTWSFLQPDWIATAAAVLTVGVALFPRRAWIGVALGSCAVWVAIAVKTPTVAWAAIALIAVAWVSWRRALATGVGAVLVTGVWYVLTTVFQPWEITWLKDQAAMARNSPLNHGFRVNDLGHVAQLTVNVAIVNPIVVIAPAAAVLLVKRAVGRRWLAALSLVCVAGLSVASPYAQGQWFMYHFAGMPVVASALWAVALGRRSAARVVLLVAPLIAAGFSLWAMRQPVKWRTDHLILVAVVVTALALIVVLAALVADRTATGGRVANHWQPLVGLVAALTLVVPYLPGTVFSFDAYDATVPAAGRSSVLERQYREIRNQMGADTAVTYLAFGSVIYELGNPTTCRYPSPLFLQRATWWPDVVTPLKSYQDNLACLSHDGGARYLVMQPAWFVLRNAAAPVKEYVAQFNCSREGRLRGGPVGVWVCPRKNG